MDKLINNVKDNLLFKRVNDEELAYYFKNIKYTLKTFKKGEIIAQEDEKCVAISLVLNGEVNIERIYPSGNGIVMKKVSCGDVFGEALIFSKKTTYPATIICRKDCEILYLKKEEVKKLFSFNDKILENFLMLLSDKVVMLNNKIKSISLKSVKQKVVDYILQECINQKSNIIKLKSSKEEIASFIGVPRPSLSRELIKLRDENLIKFNRNTIEILNGDKLEEILFN